MVERWPAGLPDFIRVRERKEREGVEGEAVRERGKYGERRKR
jgi:hypothetical protein